MPIDFHSDRPGQDGGEFKKINEKIFGSLVKSFYLYTVIKNDKTMKPLLLNIDKFLEDDNFTPETLGDLSNWSYFSKLSELKKEFKDFFTQSAVSFEYSNIGQIYNRIQAYIIQIQRLRLVIQPHFKLVIQEHTDARLYILVRADWVDDNGVRGRIVARVIGRLSPGQTKDVISTEKAREVIVPVLREKYKKCEEKFGILI